MTGCEPKVREAECSSVDCQGSVQWPSLLRKACRGPDRWMNHHETSQLRRVTRSVGDEVKVSMLRITLQCIVPDAAGFGSPEGSSFRERGVWDSERPLWTTCVMFHALLVHTFHLSSA